MSTLLLARRRGGASGGPPPEPSAFTPNEPAGFTTFLDHTWNSTAAPSGWTLDERGSDVAFGTGAGTGPENATSWGLTLRGGQTMGQLAILERTLPANTRRVYSAFTMRLAAGWQFHPSGLKVLYPFFTSTGRPFSFNILPTNGNTGGKFNWRTETFYLDNPGVTNPLAENQGAADLDVNTWVRMEFLYENNATIDAANGRVRWWSSVWNGSAYNAPVLRADHPNVVLWHTYPPGPYPGTFGRWEYNLFYGGGEILVNADQLMEFNRAYLSTSTTGL